MITASLDGSIGKISETDSPINNRLVANFEVVRSSSPVEIEETRVKIQEEDERERERERESFMIGSLVWSGLV